MLALAHHFLALALHHILALAHRLLALAHHILHISRISVNKDGVGYQGTSGHRNTDPLLFMPGGKPQSTNLQPDSAILTSIQSHTAAILVV
jgi:hypothetical protein